MNRNGSARFHALLSVILGLLLLAVSPAPLPVFAGRGEVALEIAGEGVTAPLSLTLAELEAMGQYEQVYSTINTWPTKRWYLARGVKLKELLTLAGIKEEATLLKFVAADNYATTLTVKELLADKRYYFPGLKENHPSDGSIPGSPEGRVEVEPVLALESAEDSTDPEEMDDRYGLMLIIGQRAVTEQTWLLYVKQLRKIEVLIAAPEKWDAPKVNVPDGSALPPGTELKLENKNTDADKIYYTVDGSEPTVDSPMFNWSARRWWEQRNDEDSPNIPLEIVKEMISSSPHGQDIVVLKLKTIGPGKEDSEVITYTFYLDPDAEDPTQLPAVPATGLVLDQGTLNLPPGHTFQLEATVEPFNALDQKVIWRSSDTGVATVDTRGLVTVIGPGTAVITATTADGSFKVTCVINGPEGEKAKDDPPGEAALKPELEPEPEPGPEAEAEPEAAEPAQREAKDPDLPPAEEKQPGLPEQLEKELQRLIKKGDSAASDPASPADLAEGAPAAQVFEMTLDTAIPLLLEERRGPLKIFTTVAFFFLFISGMGRKYLEYIREQ